MTVKTMKESQDRVSVSVLEQKPKELFSSPEMMVYSGEIAGKVSRNIAKDTEMESGGSSESPKSVGKWRKECVHSQVLRIREEDSHLGEDKVANCGSCGAYHHHLDNHDHHDNHRYYLKPRVDLVLLSRSILPCSPLSGKTTTVKSLQ